MNRIAPLLLTAVLWTVPARPADAQDAARSDADAVEALELRTRAISEAAARSVVSVTAETRPANDARTLFPGVIVVPPQRAPERLEATGFFVRDGGVLVTTIEVARDPADFTVRLSDGVTRRAELVGSDDEFRIAVLRMVTGAPTLGATAAETLDALPPGLRSIAESSAFGGPHALGWLVSPSGDTESPDAQLTTVRAAACAESRYDRFLASAIVLPPGAAGGPLLAKDGRLLGVAVASAGTHATANGGVDACRKTLFIRGDDVLTAVGEILRDGRVRHARLGVLLDGDSNLVDQVMPGGPAELAGLRDGDTILSLAGTPVADAPAISRVLIRRRPGDSLPLDVRRGGATMSVRVTVDEIGMPRFPPVAPVPGAVMEIAMRAATRDAPASQTVWIRDVGPESGLAAAGGRVGDEVVSVDGTDVRRFLQRHRVRPAARPPAEIVVRRDGVETKLSLPR